MGQVGRGGRAAPPPAHPVVDDQPRVRRPDPRRDPLPLDPTDRSEPLITYAEDHAAVSEANAAYYAAFEKGEVKALDDVWEPTDKTLCTHPGWSTLQGWNAIRSSYARIMENQALQFIVTGVEVRVMGEAAMVSCDENIWGEGATGTVAALNVFHRQEDGRWLMVAHHGSPVAPQRPSDSQEDPA